MAEQHTKGPWGVSRDRRNSTLIGSNMLPTLRIFQGNTGVSPRDQGITIALVLTDTDNPETSDADARLIAAAPELLEALEHIIETAGGAWDAEDIRQRRDHPNEPGSVSRNRFQAIDNIARAAIAKAEVVETDNQKPK